MIASCPISEVHSCRGRISGRISGVQLAAVTDGAVPVLCMLSGHIGTHFRLKPTEAYECFKAVPGQASALVTPKLCGWVGKRIPASCVRVDKADHVAHVVSACIT